MNKFEFKEIDFSKLWTGHIGLCYTTGELLADLEIRVQRPEARKRGVPDDYPVSTHVWMVLGVKDPYTISKEVSFPWFNRTKSITLTSGVWVFEETPTGFQISPISKYFSSKNIEIRKRKQEFTGEQIIALQDSILKYWEKSITYGYLAFFTQPVHTFLNADVTKEVNQHMLICSEVAAVCVNDACKGGNQAPDFEDEANTNSLEWQLNDKWMIDQDVLLKN